MSQFASSLREAARFIQDHDRFLVVNHVNPDGDATGSLLAMGWLLRQLSKQAVLVNEGMTPEKFMFLPGASEILNASEALPQKYDAVITCDCGDKSRVGRVEHWFAEGCELLNIDHHPTNDHFGTSNLIRTDAAATCEILYDLVCFMQLTVSPEMATCLYAGLLTDTGGFRYSNTTPHLMQAASALLSYGVQPGILAERLLETITAGHLKLLRKVLQTMEFSENNRVVSMAVTRCDMEEAGANDEDTEGLVNYGRNVEGVEVGVLYKEKNAGEVKVSMRSRSIIDVAAIAKSLDGGGHVRASGCTIKGGIEEARQIISDKLREAFQAAEESSYD
ncbi:bifunctional oligoribonuclease/PAP phosphatase NrnA [Aneurinibacillus sp. Ricciae_BoGa-3]|uniref:DHH family phosphoesterase n=1 Tax=Aneurinibacillus sp. Ricciae_BoGa-3 TaxID=3022697 RepID=UPI002340917E|nr:bifunctional oligoribonuclease/PAP phosphatase NrnA [Aneurinibacillus sp. Ricciae_BoGa-3]WCK52852.1 bifunctional oligoribonuclease/PAP phosphatase NrnA [Aneurinibacillus sp. Ricciae_BoGa-3]